jgi:hypothetical protein
MTMQAAEFRRLVLAIGPGEGGPATLRGAAEAARLLRLALHCVLIEDEALHLLPALPFARELRLPTHDWRPLDQAGLASDLAATEAALRRDLARLGIAQELEVQRGTPLTCLGGLCVAGDIVVLAVPRPHPADQLLAAALRSAAAVLLLPAAAPAAAAPVAVLLEDANDPAFDIAARIAAGAKAPLLAVLPDGDLEALAARGAVTIRRTLGAVRERLLVVHHAHPALEEVLAHRRAAPVLVI